MARISLESIWPYLLIPLLAYGLLLLAVYLFQSRLIYFPNMPYRELGANPAHIGLKYDDVELTTEDGVTLHGWYIPALQQRGTLLFFHGNAGNISHRLDSIQLFNQLGLAQLIIDYRGYGQSGGTPSEQGTYRDAEAAWRYLTGKRGLAANEILIFGRSLGGAVATQLAARKQPAGLILESTFTSATDLAAELYQLLPVRLLSRFQYDSKRALDSVHCPVLIAHSAGDEIIPFSHGERLFQSAREPKRFLQMRGGHNDGFLVSGPAYAQGLDAFVQELVFSTGSDVTAR